MVNIPLIKMNGIKQEAWIRASHVANTINFISHKIDKLYIDSNTRVIAIEFILHNLYFSSFKSSTVKIRDVFNKYMSYSVIYILQLYNYTIISNKKLYILQ